MTNSTEHTPGVIRRGLRSLLTAVAALSLAACAAPGPAKRGGDQVRTAVRADAPAIRNGADDSAEVAAKGDPDQRFQQALALMKARQIEPAQAAFLELSRDYPEFSGPLTDLGILYAQGSQLSLAVASLSRAVALKPDNEIAHNWLGTLHRENGDFMRAEQAYQAAIAAKPGYPQAHLNLAILYDVALHRPQQALQGYRQYQHLSGGDSLIVEAWIRELETRLDAAATATEVAGAAP